MFYAEAGLDIAFDAENVAELREQTGNDFEGYVYALSRFLDDHTNMDWEASEDHASCNESPRMGSA